MTTIQLLTPGHEPHIRDLATPTQTTKPHTMSCDNDKMEAIFNEFDRDGNGSSTYHLSCCILYVTTCLSCSAKL